MFHYLSGDLQHRHLPSKFKSFFHFRCFEVNNCPGLYWQGKTICSEEILNKVIQKVESEEEDSLFSVRSGFRDINKIDVSSKSSYKPIPKRIPRKLKKMKQLQKMKMRSVNCSTAVVECCSPDSPLSLPMRCLEKYQCHSYLWTKHMCSQQSINQVRK